MANSNSSRPSPQQENPSINRHESEASANSSRLSDDSGRGGNVAASSSKSDLDEEEAESVVEKIETSPKKNSSRLAWLPMVSFRNEEEETDETHPQSSIPFSSSRTSEGNSSSLTGVLSKENSCEENRVSVSESGYSEESRLSNELNISNDAGNSKRKRNFSNGYNSETG